MTLDIPPLPGGSPRRNIEIKARLGNLDRARQTARRLATSYLGTQHQVDTYFHAARGRLKLREIDGLSAELVWYERPDAAGAKASDYVLVPVTDPHALKQVLAAALGVRAVVDKRREVYLIENVRVHLDEVVGLGTFLEFEAVLGSDCDDAQGHHLVERLCREFDISTEDLVSGSYSELVLKRS
jgi:adenylate cyclase class 2